MVDEGGDRNGDGERNGGGRSEGEGPGTVEKIVMVLSVAFTVALLAFVLWQALTTPTGVDPTASIVDTQLMSGDGVRVTVQFTNPSDIGVEMALVEVDCTSPPTGVEFQHVPAEDYQEAKVVCPEGTTDPNASVTWWMEA